MSPYPSAVFDEVSAVAYGGIPFGVVGDRAELPPATAGAPQPSLQHSVTKAKGLRLVRYRPLFRGPAVERTPELRFQRPLPEVELSAHDATSRQIRPGDDVTVRRTVRPSDSARASARTCAPVSCASPRSTRATFNPTWSSPGEQRRALVDLADQGGVIVNLVMVAFAYTTWLERKLLGRMQLRYGPNRAGPFGLLQPIADLIKLIRKESFFPVARVDTLYITAPVISMFTALAAFAVIRSAPAGRSGDYHVNGEIANVSIGLILIFALGSIGSTARSSAAGRRESKYSLLGSMRTCAQLVSYEVSLALSVLGVVIMGQSLNLVDIVDKQGATIWFFIPQLVGLARLLLRRRSRRRPAAVRPARGGHRARRRVPHRIRRHALGALPDGGVHQHDHALGARGDAVLRRLARAVGAARAALVPPQGLRPRLVFIWLRASVPRLRYDQLMRFGWKVLLPVATINAVVTALLVVWID